ncbi:MAG: ABA4-like family protein [Myxococcota bacterium]
MDEFLFSLSNLAVLPFWALMVAAPRWSWTKRIIASPWSTLPAALVYALLIVPIIPEVLPELAQPELSVIARSLGEPHGALIGWVHFLAFDYIVGRWAYFDARARGLSAWLVSPSLLLIFMFGPLGYVVYMMVSARSRREADSNSTEASVVLGWPMS